MFIASIPKDQYPIFPSQKRDVSHFADHQIYNFLVGYNVNKTRLLNVFARASGFPQYGVMSELSNRHAQQDKKISLEIFSRGNFISHYIDHFGQEFGEELLGKIRPALVQDISLRVDYHPSGRATLVIQSGKQLGRDCKENGLWGEQNISIFRKSLLMKYHSLHRIGYRVKPEFSAITSLWPSVLVELPTMIARANYDWVKANPKTEDEKAKDKAIQLKTDEVLNQQVVNMGLVLNKKILGESLLSMSHLFCRSGTNGVLIPAEYFSESTSCNHKKINLGF